MEDIKEVHYLRDDQIPKTMYFRGINQRFSMKNVISGIVEIDGPSLVILDRKKNFYLIIRQESKDSQKQILELLKDVSISMYMEVPLRKSESIPDEENYDSDESDEMIVKSLKGSEDQEEA